MLSSFSNLVNNVAEGIHRIHYKKRENVELNRIIAGSVLNTQTLKMI